MDKNGAMKTALRCKQTPWVVLLCVLSVGCGKHVDDPFAGLVEWSPPDQSFTIRYLSPPWRFGEQLGQNLRIEIPRSGDTVAGADAAIEPFPKYRLVTSVEAGSPGEVSDDISAPSGALDVVLRKAFETYEDVEGVELGWRDEADDVNHRIVLLPHVDGTLRVEVTGFPVLFEPEVTDMLRSISVRVAP